MKEQFNKLVKQVVEVENEIWNELTKEQKTGWVIEGTICFTSYIMIGLGISEDMFSEDEYEYCVSKLNYESELWKEVLDNVNSILSSEVQESGFGRFVEELVKLQNQIWNELTKEQRLDLYFLGICDFINVVMLFLSAIKPEFESDKYRSKVNAILESMVIKEVLDNVNSILYN